MTSLKPWVRRDKCALCYGYLGVFSSEHWGASVPWHWGGCVDQDGAFMPARYREIIEEASGGYGLNTVRVNTIETKFRDEQKQMLTPYPWDAAKGAYAVELDDERWHKAFASILETNVGNNVVTDFCLFDGCGNHTGPGSRRVARFNPYITNTRGINLFNYDKSLPLAKELAKRFIDRYREYIDKGWIVLEIMNEFDREGNSVDSSSRWLAQMADFILQEGLVPIAPESVCWGAKTLYDYDAATKKFVLDKDNNLTVVACRLLSRMVNKRTGKIYNDAADRSMDRMRVSVHRIGIPGEKVWGVAWPFGERAAFIVQEFNDKRTRFVDCSSDGVKNGASKLDREPDGAWPRADKAQTKAVVGPILKRCGGKYILIELLPSNNHPAAWGPGAEGLGEEYVARFGVKPYNQGRKPVYPPPAPPEPPPVVDPPPAPEPEGKKIDVRVWIAVAVAVAAIVFLIFK